MAGSPWVRAARAMCSADDAYWHDAEREEWRSSFGVRSWSLSVPVGLPLRAGRLAAWPCALPELIQVTAVSRVACVVFEFVCMHLEHLECRLQRLSAGVYIIENICVWRIDQKARTPRDLTNYEYDSTCVAPSCTDRRKGLWGPGTHLSLPDSMNRAPGVPQARGSEAAGRQVDKPQGYTCSYRVVGGRSPMLLVKTQRYRGPCS